MPVRGPWCGRVYAWVIKYDEKREGSDAVDLLGFLNVRRARLMRLLAVARCCEQRLSSCLSILNARKFKQTTIDIIF